MGNKYIERKTKDGFILSSVAYPKALTIENSNLKEKECNWPKILLQMGTNIFGMNLLPLPHLSVNGHNSSKYPKCTKNL